MKDTLLCSLEISKYSRLYNDVIRTKLEKAEIEFEEKCVRNGYKLFISKVNFETAIQIVRNVSYTNPKY